MPSFRATFLLIAVFCFFLAGIGVTHPRFSLTDLGFAAVAAALLVS